ncbi:MAG TPA: hypothetical protein VI522_02950 [Gammaproteobacteria bacterium]|nr:hypothetical protein [Gammaproteobacteria bacterium]
MANHTDLIGKRFGKLTVISRNGSKGRSAAWQCKCECGAIVTTRADNLLNGNTTSCGCKRYQSAATKAAGKGQANAHKYIVHYFQCKPILGSIHCYARIFDIEGLEIKRIAPCGLQVYPGSQHSMTRKVFDLMDTADAALFKFIVHKTLSSPYDVVLEWGRLQEDEPI